MLASKVLKSGKKRQEVKNDLLSNMAPPIIQSCSTISFERLFVNKQVK